MSTQVRSQIVRMSQKWFEEGDIADRQLYCIGVSDEFIDRLSDLLEPQAAREYLHDINNMRNGHVPFFGPSTGCVIDGVDVLITIVNAVCARRPLVDIMWRAPASEKECYEDGEIAGKIYDVIKNSYCDCIVFATGEMGCLDGVLDWPVPSYVVDRDG